MDRQVFLANKLFILIENKNSSVIQKNKIPTKSLF